MPKAKIDLLGQRFGELKVIEYDEVRSKQAHRSYWKCQCSCGEIKSIRASDIVNAKSCGCLKRLDLKGRKFGLLTVLERVKNTDTGQTRWRCMCDCGNISIVLGTQLTQNHTTSCGCLNISIGESNIQSILKNNNIDFIREYKFADLGLYRFDFYLPDYNRLIEFDGRQHYQESSFSNQKTNNLPIIQQSDSLKNEYAKNNNIPLVRIPYWERDTITLDMIMGDKYLVQ